MKNKLLPMFCLWSMVMIVPGVSAWQPMFAIPLETVEAVTKAADTEKPDTSQGNNQLLKESRKVFADELCTVLKPGVGQQQVSKIKDPMLKNLAQELLEGKHDQEFRTQFYQAYRPIKDLARELKTSGYQNFENPTGICFAPDDEALVFVGDTHGEQVNLITTLAEGKPGGIHDSFPLKPGINKVKFAKGGLSYIQYFTPNYQTAHAVKVHIVGGRVNGYFDMSKHNPKEWKERLDKAVYDYFDLVGERIHVTYHVEDLRKYTPNGTDLIGLYNDIVCMEHDIMGLPQYNRVPRNRMYISAVKGGMYAAGWGVGLARGAMNTVAVPEKVRKGKTWALAHELGHVNQIRPNLNWGGTDEVTNNIYSVLIRYHYTPEDTNLEREKCWDGDGWSIPGGRFNSFLTYGIAKGEAWMYQRGQDNRNEHTDKQKGYADKGGDHFVKLCPLWQLFLYYRIMEGKAGEHYNWFGNIAEQERRSTDQFKNPGDWQLKFMRSVCHEVDTDLTSFFEKVGMLHEYDNRYMDDYGNFYITITPAQIENLKKEMSTKKKPEALIHYLSANSLDVYRYKKELTGGKTGEGISLDGDAALITHSVWQNAVVFETYKDKELTHVAIVGTGHGPYEALTDTKVHYPEGSTAIYAVGWNGKRLLVYGSPVEGIE